MVHGYSLVGGLSHRCCSSVVGSSLARSSHFRIIVTIVPWSAHSTRDGYRISCSLRVYARFGFSPQSMSLSSALVILLVLIIVAQIYLAAGICRPHPGISFFRVSAILACSLFESPWNFFQLSDYC